MNKEIYIKNMQDKVLDACHALCPDEANKIGYTLTMHFLKDDELIYEEVFGGEGLKRHFEERYDGRMPVDE